MSVTTLEQQLRRDEGEVLHAYQDSESFWTIGVGRLIDRRRGGGISRAESALLLNNDIQRVDAALSRRVPWFDGFAAAEPVRVAVLRNMAFQMGVDGLLSFVRTLGHVQRGAYSTAATEMLRSRWASQTPNRAHRLAEQMRTGGWR